MAVSVETNQSFSKTPAQLLFATIGYNAPPELVTNRRLDVSPDGNRFLMLKLSGDASHTGHPILIKNWFDELQRLVPTP